MWCVCCRTALYDGDMHSLQQNPALIESLRACAGVVQLLNAGHLPHDFWAWDFSAGFSWGPDADEEEAQPAEAAAGKHRCCDPDTVPVVDASRPKQYLLPA